MLDKVRESWLGIWNPFSDVYFEVFYEQPAIQRIAIESERLFFGHLKCLLERIGHYMQSLLLLLQYLL